MTTAVRGGDLDEMERCCRRHIETAGREMVLYLETTGLADTTATR